MLTLIVVCLTFYRGMMRPEFMAQAEKLADSVIHVESRGNPNVVSSCGAQGLMQLMPATGREIHEELGIEEPYDPFDPVQNRRIGTYYLAKLLDRLPTKELAIAAYNAGPGRVAKAMRRSRSIKFACVRPYLPKETQDYVVKVLGHYKGEIV